MTTTCPVCRATVEMDAAGNSACGHLRSPVTAPPPAWASHRTSAAGPAARVRAARAPARPRHCATHPASGRRRLAGQLAGTRTRSQRLREGLRRGRRARDRRRAAPRRGRGPRRWRTRPRRRIRRDRRRPRLGRPERRAAPCRHRDPRRTDGRRVGHLGSGHQHDAHRARGRPRGRRPPGDPRRRVPGLDRVHALVRHDQGGRVRRPRDADLGPDHGRERRRVRRRARHRDRPGHDPRRQLRAGRSTCARTGRWSRCR